MELRENLVCPKCSSRNFLVKREVTYVYTYRITSDDSKDVAEKTECLPFLFDNREKCDSVEYIVCEKCGKNYPVDLAREREKIDFTILQKSVRSDTTKYPEFLG